MHTRTLLLTVCVCVCVCVCVMCASDFHFLGSSNDLNLRSKNIYVRSPSVAFHCCPEALQRP
jgi:hypothetical protein